MTLYFRYQKNTTARPGPMEAVQTVDQLAHLLRLRATGGTTRTYYTAEFSPQMRARLPLSEQPVQAFVEGDETGRAWVWQSASPHTHPTRDVPPQHVLRTLAASMEDAGPHLAELGTMPYLRSRIALKDHHTHALYEAEDLTWPGVGALVQEVAAHVCELAWDDFASNAHTRATRLMASQAYYEAAQLIDSERDEPCEHATPAQILALIQVADAAMGGVGSPVGLHDVLTHLTASPVPRREDGTRGDG